MVKFWHRPGLVSPNVLMDTSTWAVGFKFKRIAGGGYDCGLVFLCLTLTWWVGGGDGGIRLGLWGD